MDLDDVDCQVDNGSILQLGMDQVQENQSNEGSRNGMSDDDDNDDVANIEALLRRRIGQQEEQRPKEEIMGVKFILDWIPSYLLVISKVHKNP